MITAMRGKQTCPDCGSSDTYPFWERVDGQRVQVVRCHTCNDRNAQQAERIRAQQPKRDRIEHTFHERARRLEECRSCGSTNTFPFSSEEGGERIWLRRCRNCQAVTTQRKSRTNLSERRKRQLERLGAKQARTEQRERSREIKQAERARRRDANEAKRRANDEWWSNVSDIAGPWLYAIFIVAAVIGLFAFLSTVEFGDNRPDRFLFIWRR